MEICRGCKAEITYAYREWWDKEDNNVCEELGTHFPFVRTQLPPTPVVNTSGPVNRWRGNRTNRIAPPKPASSGCIVIVD